MAVTSYEFIVLRKSSNCRKLNYGALLTGFIKIMIATCDLRWKLLLPYRNVIKLFHCLQVRMSDVTLLQNA